MIHRPTHTHPYLGILEIAVLIVVFTAGIWLIGPMFGTSIGFQILFWVLIVGGGVYVIWVSPFLLHQYNPEDWGWKIFSGNHEFPGSFRSAWPVYTLFTAFAAAILILYSLIFTPESFNELNLKAITLKFVGYLLYGTTQSLIFFGFIFIRLREFMSTVIKPGHTNIHRLSVVILTAVIFSSFHLPNTALMGFTLLAGIFWGWIFYQRPNILLMGISHAILGTILHQVVQLYTRIGPFYENPNLYVFREVIPGLKKLIGDLF